MGGVRVIRVLQGVPACLGHARTLGAESEGLEEAAGADAFQLRAALYREADLLVLPTFSENFGVVVAEALAAGVPVITTHGAPWADLETHDCGWWIETGVAPLVLALREALTLSNDERRAMGERGLAYVQRYDWNAIAVETLALYRWVLGQGERPRPSGDCWRTRGSGCGMSPMWPWRVTPRPIGRRSWLMSPGIRSIPPGRWWSIRDMLAELGFFQVIG